MSSATARRALDFFFASAAPRLARAPSHRLAVTFYGGEPLLAPDVLRTAVAHAEQYAPVELLFALTTNGTLLSGDIVDFLVQHNVHILVSLDGDLVNHDRNRRFPDGSGSFGIVCRNLRIFRDRYPDYPGIRLIAVIDWSTDLPALAAFFDAEAWLPPLHMVTWVSDVATDYYRSFSQEQKDRFKSAQSALEQQYLRDRSRGTEISPFGKAYFDARLRRVIHRRRHGNPTLPWLPFTNPCVPGWKLAVQPNGTFELCERVNGQRPIGDLRSGIDVEAVQSLIADYNRTVCVRCWCCPITKVCPKCFAVCNHGSSFKSSENDCERTVTNTRDAFSRAYSVLEANPHAFPPLSAAERQLAFLDR
jgi:uncharacterized protein